MRPIIAVAGVPITAGGVVGWRRDAVAVQGPYLDALRRAGAEPAILVPEPLDESRAEERLARFDGLLLPGGGDIDPVLYGEMARPEVAWVNAARDAFEIPLIRAAVSRGLPALGICRGAQVLNVALGGNLVQHISDRDDLVAHRSPDGADGVLHPVRVQQGSCLAKAMGAERADAFSHHHQALDRLADGLVPVAWSDDGLLEAVEYEEGWVVGLQWHAEVTAGTDPLQQAIFDTLVEEAAGR